MKNTKAHLEYRLKTISTVLDRPSAQFSSKLGEPTRFTVGYLVLERTSQGYQIQEQTSEIGGVTYWSDMLSASEMDAFLSGMLNGISISKVSK